MLKLKFTTLTPLHISNGEQLGYGLDYVLKDSFIYKLNPRKVAEVFSKKKIIDFSKNYSLDDLIKIIKDNIDYLGYEESFYKVYCSNRFLDYVKSNARRGQKFIKEFININGNFYIPASSIKGALLTTFNKPLLELTKEISGEKKKINVKQEHFGIKEFRIEGKTVLEASLKDKFVISDSDFLDCSNFSVIIFDRPPSQNLICLKENVSFTLEIKKVGNFDINFIRNQLVNYSKNQIKIALDSINKFEKMKGKETKGSRYFKAALNNLNIRLKDIQEDEYLINIGFGGGTYFKIFNDIEKIPKNKNNEFIHTSYTESLENRRNHIGWCKLKIEEE